MFSGAEMHLEDKHTAFTTCAHERATQDLQIVASEPQPSGASSVSHVTIWTGSSTLFFIPGVNKYTQKDPHSSD